jgi:hypothetical protein
VRGASRDLSALFYAPQRFFAARAEEPGGTLAAIAFALGCQLVGSCLEWTWYRLGWSLQSAQMIHFHSFASFVLAQAGILLVILPLEAFTVHVLLSAFGAARGSLGATFRMCAYTQVAALCSVIPLVGSVLGMLSGVALLVVGVREVHRMTTKGAAFVAALGLFRLFAIALLAVAGAATLLRYR